MKFISICTFLLMVSFPILAQNAIEDFRPLLKKSVPIAHIDFQNDGKIITGSSNLSVVGNHSVNGLVRLNADGTLDSSFKFEFDITQGGVICDLFVQDDDKIIVSGQNMFQGITPSPLIRLLADGSLDETFNFPIPDLYLIQVIPVLDDKYIVVGFPDSDLPGIIRINNDGSIDETFDVGNGFDEMSKNSSVLMQEDGKIIFIGSFSRFNDQPANNIVRINLDGSLDNTFQIGTGSSLANGSAGYLRSITEQSDGKLLVGGHFDSFSGTSARNIIRLNADGSLDAAFKSTEVPGVIDFVGASIVLPNNDILVSGRNALFKLNHDGSIDESFVDGYMNQVHTNSFFPGLNALTQSPEGTIYLGGVFTRYNNEIRIGMAAIEEDGTLTDFNPHLGAYPTITTVESQTDGKIIVVGDFLNPITEERGGQIARFNIDGTLDVDFTGKTQAWPPSSVKDIAIGPNDEIYLGGTFSSFNDIPFPGLVKLASDGTLDQSFRPAITRRSDGIEQILIQGDQIILAGGIEAANIDQLVRVDANTGTIDESFNAANQLPLDAGDDLLRNLTHVAMQSDGKILVFGWYPFSGKGGFILRFSGEGVLDDTFSAPDLPLYRFTSVAVLPNDEIVFGAFPIAGAEYQEQIPLFHLNADGGLIDNMAILYQEAMINAILPLTDTEIIIGGTFDDINSQPINTLAKIALDGNISNFNTGMRIFSEIHTLKRINDNEFILAGLFGGFRKRAGYSSIAKMTINNQIPLITQVDVNELLFEDSLINLTIDNFTIEDDNFFPNEFAITLEAGENYEINGTVINPVDDFNGVLNITASVFDGHDSSAPFIFDLPVIPVNDAPEINGYQGTTVIGENESIEVFVSDLDVTDVDNIFPNDFTLFIGEGDNYQIEGSILTPATDFLGTINVPITVNDGELNSEILTVAFDVDEILNVEINSDSDLFRIFPNPTVDQIVISMTDAQEVSAVALYTLSGSQLIYSEALEGQTSLKLDLSTLSQGIYLLSIYTQGGQLTQRIRKD